MSLLGHICHYRNTAGMHSMNAGSLIDQEPLNQAAFMEVLGRLNVEPALTPAAIYQAILRYIDCTERLEHDAMMKRGPTIGVDLDGTLAVITKYQGPHHIEEPIMAMIERVKHWLSEGREVVIFTARVGHLSAERVIAINTINAFCLEHFGRTLPVTNKKDYSLVEYWDDRAVQVECNTGRRVGDKTVHTR